VKYHTPRTSRLRRLGLVTLASGSLTLAFAASPAFAATAPNLGTAGAASVAAGTAVTNTGPTTMSGNLDLYPGTAVSGFPPGIVGGTQNVGGPTGGVANVASDSVTAAYLQALAAPTTAVMNSDLGGKSLSAGVYSASSGMSLTGTVTLVGDANSVFIFQAVSTLTANPGSNVVLSGGVRACNVFWQVGSSATLDTTSSFVGTILALTSISMKTGATLQGRALARNGAVTLDDNTITTSTCSAVTPPATTTTTAATTTTTKGSTTTTTQKSSPTVTTPVSSASPTTTTTVARRRPSSSAVTTTTAPPLIGAPVTGGGPTPTHGSPWLWLGLAGLITGSALFVSSGARRSRIDRR
jgi:hypothetical protein